MKAHNEIGRIGDGIYTAKDASRIFKIPYSKVNYWFQWYLKKGKFKLDYQYHFAIKDTLAVNFLTLIEMYVFYTLKENGVKTSAILKAHSILSEKLKTPYPFAQEDYYSLGNKIYFGNSTQLASADEKVQFTFRETLVPYSKKINFGENRLAHKFYPLGSSRSVVVDPSHQFGQPTITGTNILVATIYDWHLSKESNDFIAELYKIPVQSVVDAIDFWEDKKMAA